MNSHLLASATLLSLTALSPSVFAAPSSATSANGFGLDELFRSTLTSSETLLQSEEALVQSEEIKNQSSSAFLPTVNFLGTYTRQDDASSGIGSSISPTTQKTARINAKQYLFQGTSEYAFLKQAKRNVEAAQENVKAEKQRLYLKVASLYYNTLLKEKELGHAETELKLYDDQIKELRSRARIGRSRPSDVLTVEAARAQVEARKQTTESELRAYRVTLSSLARKPEDMPLKEELPFSETLQPLEFYLKASEERPDLKAASLSREASEHAIGVARGSHFPSLDVTGNYYFERPGVNANSKWDASLNLTVPIFAGGATQSNVRAAASRFRVAEVQYQLLARELRDEVRSLHQTLDRSTAEMKALEKAFDLAQKNYEQIQKDFRFGLVNNLDLVQALKNLEDARRTLDQTRYQHHIERVQLEVAAGLLPKNT